MTWFFKAFFAILLLLTVVSPGKGQTPASSTTASNTTSVAGSSTTALNTTSVAGSSTTAPNASTVVERINGKPDSSTGTAGFRRDGPSSKALQDGNSELAALVKQFFCYDLDESCQNQLRKGCTSCCVPVPSKYNQVFLKPCCTTGLSGAAITPKYRIIHDVRDGTTSYLKLKNAKGYEYYKIKKYITPENKDEIHLVVIGRKENDYSVDIESENYYNEYEEAFAKNLEKVSQPGQSQPGSSSAGSANTETKTTETDSTDKSNLREQNDVSFSLRLQALDQALGIYNNKYPDILLREEAYYADLACLRIRIARVLGVNVLNCLVGDSLSANGLAKPGSTNQPGSATISSTTITSSTIISTTVTSTTLLSTANSSSINSTSASPKSLSAVSEAKPAPVQSTTAPKAPDTKKDTLSLADRLLIEANCLQRQLLEKLDQVGLSEIERAQLTRLIASIRLQYYFFISRQLPSPYQVFGYQFSTPNKDLIKWAVKEKGKGDPKLTVSREHTIRGGFKIDYSAGIFLTGLSVNEFVVNDYRYQYKVASQTVLTGQTSATTVYSGAVRDTVGKLISVNNTRYNYAAGFLAHAYVRTGTFANVGTATGVLVNNDGFQMLIGLSALFGSGKSRLAFSYGFAIGKQKVLSSTAEQALYDRYRDSKPFNRAQPYDKNELPFFNPSNVVETFYRWNTSCFFGLTYNFGSTTVRIPGT